jgi:hypothetical protein
LLDRPIDVLLFSTGDRHLGTVLGKAFCNAKIDSGRATEHKDVLSREVEH